MPSFDHSDLVFAADASNSDNDQQTAETKGFQPSPRLYTAFTGLLVMTLMVALEGTVVSVAIATIAAKLKGTSTEAFWVGTAYLVASTVFQPVTASLSYVYGRKAIITVSLVFFGLGSIVCGAAKDFTAILAGRSLQGMGGAGIITMTEVVLTDLIPLQQRGTYTGVLGSMYALGGGAGPIVGGALASTSWRWIFWINLPFVGLACILIWFFLRLKFQPSKPASKWEEVDWLGTTLFVGATTSLLIPISWGGVQEPWTSWRTLLPLLVGIFGNILFGIYSARWAKYPLIPRDIFPNWSANLGYINSGLQGIIVYALLYFLPLYLEGVKEFSTLKTGVVLLPFTVGVAPAACVTGVLITKFDGYRWAIWLGWTVSTLGLGLLLLLKLDTVIWKWVLLVLVSAVGTGIVSPALQFQVQASQRNQKTVGLAISMYSFTRSVGQTLGVAIGGAIFQNRLRSTLQSDSVDLSNFSNNAVELVQIIKSMSPGAEKTALKNAYVDSLRVVWLFVTALSGFALFLSLFVQAYPMDVAMETDQGLLEKKELEKGQENTA